MVSDPLFWLSCSLFLMALSLTAVLIVAIPVLQEVARAARSAEKLFDTLHREFPPTLHSIRLTGLEITELTDDIDSGVKSASDIVKQVDNSLNVTQTQIKKVQTGTRRLVKGFQVAWKTWNRSSVRIREEEKS
ncbi:unknown [Crocosphaera subtropica ATCC 51142]|uniref:DUF948 domain-containing protein n=1 Tax=Crocosphaera subtropica (strain ATCC 51142 / BH68) TaxID=43989 RepID=B1X0M8_CROS5|nr:hypothetical protein [Crocosphaera subtropica]ACB51317.1 unknown [Crocosphaera subtropica ATCC 51142]